MRKTQAGGGTGNRRGTSFPKEAWGGGRDKVTFSDDAALKERAIAENPSIKQIYGTASNPLFTLLYIDVEEIETFSFDEGPKKIKL